MQISLAGTPEVKICIEERKRRKKETMMYEKKFFFLVSKSLGDTSSLSFIVSCMYAQKWFNGGLGIYFKTEANLR